MSLEKTVQIITIISLILGALVIIPQIKWPDLTSDDIEIVLEPKEVTEGIYEEIPIKITIPDIKKDNITYLSLRKNDIIIEREDDNDQLQVATSISWDGYNGDFVFLYDNLHSGLRKDNLVAEGTWYGCKNCNAFIGEKHPYTFKFPIIYRIGNGEKISTTVKVDVPIV